MTECDCRSYAPFILLIFIPIMILVDHHDEPNTTTQRTPIDYQTPINDFTKTVSSYGLTGLLGFSMIVGIISYKSWKSYHKELAVMMLLTIPLYYWFFIDPIPLSMAFPFPHLVNQTMVSKP